MYSAVSCGGLARVETWRQMHRHGNYLPLMIWSEGWNYEWPLCNQFLSSMSTAAEVPLILISSRGACVAEVPLILVKKHIEVRCLWLA